MKVKKHYAADSLGSDADRELEVQQEIDSFLRAVSSYPDRFARGALLEFPAAPIQHRHRNSHAGHERRSAAMKTSPNSEILNEFPG